MTRTVTISVNGQAYTNEVEPRLLLVHYLRDVLSLTGTHVGCETSLCGACTVVLNGQAVKSCTVLAVQADGGEILTVEGLEKDGKLHPLQDGFWEEHGLQCGFCTPGHDYGFVSATCSDFPIRQKNKSATDLKATCAAARGINIL